jgi:hypothetical protein
MIGFNTSEWHLYIYTYIHIYMYEIIEEKEPLNAIQVRNVRLRTMGNLELLKGTAAVSLLIIAILGGARGRWGEGVG